MVVIVKGNRSRQFIVKAASVLFLFVMFFLYYQHMSDKFQEQNQQLVNKLEVKKQNKIDNKILALEKTIYKEAVVIVNLLEQKHVQSIKIVKDKLLIICDFTTDIEPVLVRYGVNAMVKSTDQNIKIALDLRTIVENKYES